METEIICGICNNKTVLTSIPLQSVSEWDKENNYLRKEAYICCNRIWMYGRDYKLYSFPIKE